jgi:uncharacterized membrane protein YhaH (DUF805 family)
MDFVQAIRAGFANYVSFGGRAVRSEYWFWLLFTMLGDAAALILDAGLSAAHVTASSPFGTLFYLVTLLPTLTVSVRRLHDIDRSGWWLLVGLTVIGILLLMYWACVKGTTGYNRFGADPFGSGGHIARPATAADRAREQAWRARKH